MSNPCYISCVHGQGAGVYGNICQVTPQCDPRVSIKPDYFQNTDRNTHTLLPPQPACCKVWTLLTSLLQSYPSWFLVFCRFKNERWSSAILSVFFLHPITQNKVCMCLCLIPVYVNDARSSDSMFGACVYCCPAGWTSRGSHHILQPQRDERAQGEEPNH